jgi:hypothetical protein
MLLASQRKRFGSRSSEWNAEHTFGQDATIHWPERPVVGAGPPAPGARRSLLEAQSTGRGGGPRARDCRHNERRPEAVAYAVAYTGPQRNSAAVFSVAMVRSEAET